MTTTDSVIHDIGYKPYTGPRLGRAHILRSLFWFSLRSAFGFGRGARARIIPLACFTAMLLPAAISIYKVASVGGDPVLTYAHYADSMSLFLIVFVAVAAPELVSRDLRHHTLPLYFSRPLRRGDYPLAKLLALACAILLFEALPLLVMYLGIIASSTSGSGVWNQTRALVPGLLVALAYGLAFAPLALLIGSMTGRRAIVTGAIAILFLATSAVSHVLESAGTHLTPAAGIEQAQPVPPRGIADGSQPGITIGSQPGNPDEPPPFRLTRTYDSVARYGGLADPLRLVEGTRVWALNATDGQMPDPGNAGALYAFELIVLTGLTTGGLFLRYRKVGVA
ncbi:ABC transporter permease subunit [Actinocrinis puniceicyclus]|uniref:ABC transporter permease subunit n=1 Tax=Actinocrinis puniceicyclus TaxID=977794 RepID=A0A8J7WQZ5_9ACTN|nr:ABC transporter permease subunit [Actinocrinis puniceicyclus]MBS2964529.1 ABC transporter permease subunit [Actinocrinis puniceicyclus]